MPESVATNKMTHKLNASQRVMTKIEKIK